jgi:hypothetical protein
MVLAGLGAGACSEPPEREELLLYFDHPGAAKLEVSAGGTPKMVDPAANQVVRVRVAGATGATMITVTIFVDGKICATVSFTFEDAKNGEYRIDIEAMCRSSPDAGVPMAPVDAAPPDADPDPSGCIEYCAVMRQQCPGVYPSGDQECLATCASFGWRRGMPGVLENSVACRVSRARMAAMPNDLFRCFEAGPSGGERCGRFCNNYCEAALKNCKDALPFASAAACLDTCMGSVFAPELRSVTGDTAACRIHYLGEAGKDEGRSCEKASWSSSAASPCHN